MKRVSMSVAAVLLALLPVVAFGQTKPIDRYLAEANLPEIVNKPLRTPGEVAEVLPGTQVEPFIAYVRAKWARSVELTALRQAVEQLRLNKTVGSAPGGAGTSLVSRVAVPGVIGFASEFGSILQDGSGNANTLRANALGVANLIGGRTQFPYCPEIGKEKCQSLDRWLRLFSVSASFESAKQTDAVGAAESSPSAPPTAVALVGDGFRLATWSARVDLSWNDPDDPKFLSKWTEAISALRANQAGVELTQAINDLLADSTGTPKPAYLTWKAAAEKALANVPPGDFAAALEVQLDSFIESAVQADPGFMGHVLAVSRAHEKYFAARDDLLKAIQSHQMSAEYSRRMPVDQPGISTFRFVYSHQPSKKPVLVTVNAAVSWYTAKPTLADTEQMRDIQVAAQVDRRLGTIAGFGNAVATIGAYYQWMAEDALITIGPGNVAPGSGIVLPDTAAKLLNTKGHIGVVQGKLTFPISGVVKVPFSLSWSNRTELRPTESHVWKGQVGFTLDLDSVMKK